MHNHPTTQPPQAPHKVLVPVANPNNARDLIELGYEFATDDTEQNVRVIALVVLNGDGGEGSTNAAAKIEEIVKQMVAEGVPVELRTRGVTNVARGIIDVANEVVADLIVLGLPSRQRGGALGAVVENVLAIAPCDVALLRAGVRDEDVKRIVVPTDGTPKARAAYSLATRISDYYDVGIEVMHAQESYKPRWEGLGRIAETVEGETVMPAKRTVIAASNAAEAVLTRLEPTDLVIVAHNSRPALERWLTGSISHQLLDRAQGPVILIVHREKKAPRMAQRTRWARRFMVQLAPNERDDIVYQAYDLSSFTVDYLALIIIAAMIASFGLLANSTAVIIGAMLVAPFMQPCIGIAVGLASGRVALVRRSALTLLGGVLVAFGVAMLAGLLIPNWQITPEMSARTNPSLLDAAIAFASGLMGAYAIARKEIPSALAGVAIAAALMPPLCTFGLETALGRPDLGVRAFLLFSINIAFISAAAMFVFFALGMRPEVSAQTRRRDYVAVLMLIVLALPFLVWLVNLSQQANAAALARETLTDFNTDARLTNLEYREQDDMIVLRAYLESTEPITAQEVKTLQDALEGRIGQPVQLEIVVQPVITAPQP